MTRSTVNTISLGPKLLVHQVSLAFGTDKAGAVPVLPLVRQILEDEGLNYKDPVNLNYC